MYVDDRVSNNQTWSVIIVPIRAFGSPAQNRTGMSSSGDLHTIHCTTGPVAMNAEHPSFNQSTGVIGKDLNGNGQQNYAKKFTYRDHSCRAERFFYGIQ